MKPLCRSLQRRGIEWKVGLLTLTLLSNLQAAEIQWRVFPIAPAEGAKWSERRGHVGWGEVLSLSGNVQAGDDRKLERALNEKPSTRYIEMEGAGDLTEEGLHVASVVRKWKLHTGVRQGRDCLQACALIWLSGTTRQAGSHANGAYGRVGLALHWSQFATGHAESALRFERELHLPAPLTLQVLTQRPAPGWLSTEELSALTQAPSDAQ